MHLKLLQKRTIQKTAKTTGDLTGNKIADKVTRVSKTLPKNNSEKNNEEIFGERFILCELRHKFTDDLRLRKKNYWLFKINIII